MAKQTRSQKQRSQRHRRQKQTPAANKDILKTLLEWFLADDGIFSQIKFHGNIKWRPTFLVSLALFWAWSSSRNLTDAFTEAFDCCQKMFASTPLSTYQG